MYFLAILLKLKLPHQKQRLSATDGVYAHAAILNKITAANAETGQKLHDRPRHKPLSIGIIGSTAQMATLRLTFMAEDGPAYADTLINALSCEPMLRLGQTECPIETVDLANPDWAGIRTWADFLSGKCAQRLCFRFMTPTAITKKDENGGRFVSLYPEPLDIFSGLARRWQALGGPQLPNHLEKFIRTGGCVVSRHHLRTVEFYTRERTQLGFIGQVVYECRKMEPDHVNALNALAHLANFTGVGYQTARGMGTVQVATAG